MTLLNKKAAMFGLCRALRKQFGELFLASRHREAPKGANGSFKPTRGAMFGLDARIALIIFSVLSVVSTATILGSIKKAEISRIIQQAEEVKKAESKFYNDIGITPTKTQSIIGANNQSIRAINQLMINRYVENTNIKKWTEWKGPYIQLNAESEYNLKSNQGEKIYLRVGSEDGTWGGSTDIPSFSGNSCPNKPCYLWVQIEVSSDEIADGIEEYIDGNADKDNGNVRIRNSGIAGSTKPSVFIKHRIWEE